jgi:hypothetical protein
VCARIELLERQSFAFRLGNEMQDQIEDVLNAFAQRRQPQRHHIEAEKEPASVSHDRQSPLTARRDAASVRELENRRGVSASAIITSAPAEYLANV